MKRVGLGKGQQLSESSKFGDRKFDVPNVVLHQLAKPAASAHPGADLLAAFSEQRLAKGEREGVFEHLAVCADCREVLSLAQPEVAAPPNVILPERTTFLSWPSLGSPMLRWGALAACAMIAISAVFLHKVNQSGKLADYARIEAKLEAPAEKLEQPKTPPALPSQLSATTESRRSAADAKSSSSLFRERGSAKGKEEDSYRTTEKSVGEVARKPARQLDALAARVTTAAGGAVASPGVGRADRDTAIDGKRNEAVSGEVLRADASNADPQPARAKAGDVEIRARAKNLDATPGVASPPAEKSSNAVVADARVNGQQAVLQEKGLRANDLEAEALQERNQANARSAYAATPPAPETAAAGRDKARGDSVAQPAASPVGNMQTTAKLRTSQLKKQASLRWRLSPVGGLERFLDTGWQEVSVGGQSSWLALATNGTNVWVGGARGTLYRSSDNGDHWTRQALDGTDLTSPGDVVSISFEDARHGQLRTSANQKWTTADGGNTWTLSSTAD